MSVRKIRACSTMSGMNPEQDNIDSFIRQAIGKEPFLSLSRAGDSPVQLIQLLHAFDQQGTDKVPKSSKGDSCNELKENSDNIFYGVDSFSSEPNGIKDHVHSLKGWESNTKGSKCTPAQMPSRKIPEAVVAFAHAAAKATSDPEKSNLPGWPLLSPSKIQLQKCDKCSREFCSSINYRRHRRVHRRSLNVDKDSQKNRDFLGTFWDKLSEDEAKELVSLRNVTIEEVTGSSVTKALSTSFRRAGVLSSLPQGYIKAGLTLLEIVQASPSMLPMSSQELFSVLDEASEKTFLCAGTALSLQKYVFDGEVVKKALEIKNIVACTSFLIEIELVKAWLVDKDAEALRCQKLLVDEEEAAHRRKAELLERKRLKKLRQKEQKQNEASNGEKNDFKGPSPDSPPDFMGSTEASSSTRDSSEDCTSEASHIQEHQVDFAESSATEDDGNAGKNISHNAQNDHQNLSDRGKSPNLASRADDPGRDVVHQTRGTGHMQSNHLRQVQSRLTQNNPSGFQAGQVSTARPLVNMRQNNSRDSKVINRPNGNKVWTIKSRPDNDEDGKYGEEADRELTNQPSVSDRSEVQVLIGSINVSLGDDELQHHCTIMEPQRQEKLVKPDSSLSSLGKTPVKLWKPVSRHGNGNLVQNDHDDVKQGVPAAKDAERLLPGGSCLAFEGLVSDFERCRGSIMFSTEAAKAFLVQRWKEAIAGDEVLIISSPDTEASGNPNHIEGNFVNIPSQSSDFHGRHILGRVENRLAVAGVAAIDPALNGSLHFKFRPKAEKTSRLKYVPKQKS
ncbi:uncharacterized protein LOC110097911 isoform X1 [Dendrobium catenatum]|nr:uncharacterized protein LOC110097911 isoform X1 [Dendrobium catenatum]